MADPIKATTPASLENLKADGVRIVMLTGDNRTTAQAVASKLGITDIEAEVLPEQNPLCHMDIASIGHAARSPACR